MKDQPKDHTSPRPAGKLKKHLRRLAIGLVVTAVIIGGVSWYAYYYVFKAGFAEVVPGKIYRCGQPTPGRVLDLVKDKGIKTVICLRGGTDPAVLAVQDAAAANGLTFYNIELSSNFPPKPERMVELIDALENSPKPALIHCRQGVDRTGMASAVAALLIGGESFEKALEQLPVMRANKLKSHVSDILAAYKAHCERTGEDIDDPDNFKRWVREDYPTADTTTAPKLVPKVPLFPDRDSL